MADEADLAEKNTVAFLTDGLTANAAALRPQHHPDFDGAHCIECGDDLPAVRLQMGRIRCTECQNARDLNRRRYAA